MITDFHFLRPWWFLALLPLAGLLWSMARRHRNAGGWRDYCDPELLPHILIDSSSSQSRLPLGLAGVTGLLAILALAGPAWERLPAPVFRNLSALVIVLDLSWAMEATDVKPNRLERARFKIDDLLRAHKDGQNALVAYAGDAFVVTPLTDDVATISAQLVALSPGIMPVQGNRLDLGLLAAEKLMRQAGQKSGDVLVVTAGEEPRAAQAEAERLKDQGYRVSVLGIGSRDGAPIPLSDGGFLRNAEGRMVVSRLDIKALWDLAQAGGGVYRTLDPGSVDTDAVLEFVERRADAGQQAGQDVHVDQWRDGGIWLLPLLVPLAALGFRRGWLGVLLLTALAPTPRPAEALEWRDLWLTPDQQAQRALAAGDARGAAERFKNPAWKAAAEYQAGEFEQAAKRLEALDTPPSHYNRGNALARQGKLEDALKAYDRALQLAPGDEDVAYNRKLVEDALKQQQQQQKQQESDPSQSGDQGQQPQPGQDGQPDHQSTPEQKDGQSSPDQPPKPGEQTDQNAQPETSTGPPDPSREDRPETGQESSGQSGAQPDAREEPGQEQASQPESGQDGQQPELPPGQPLPEDPPPGNEVGKDQAAAPESSPDPEGEQAEQQWLRRIPDDPGGLLKRKFYYQYRLRQQQEHHTE